MGDSAVVIGVIGRPHGLHGAVRAKATGPARFRIWEPRHAAVLPRVASA